MAAIDTLMKRWPLVAALASMAMLAIAHGFETFGGLAPCHLCLQQREVYWVAMAIGALGFALAFVPVRLPFRRIASLALMATFAYGAYLAAFHAGAEWKWWKAPETCASTGHVVTVDELRGLLAGKGAKGPACDVAAWRMLGVSMAGWNFVASLVLVGLSLAAALKKEPGA
jgi:disulfide bond formation protein DsbB